MSLGSSQPYALDVFLQWQKYISTVCRSHPISTRFGCDARDAVAWKLHVLLQDDMYVEKGGCPCLLGRLRKMQVRFSDGRCLPDIWALSLSMSSHLDSLLLYTSQYYRGFPCFGVIKAGISQALLCFNLATNKIPQTSVSSALIIRQPSTSVFPSAHIHVISMTGLHIPPWCCCFCLRLDSQCVWNSLKFGCRTTN